MIAQAGLFDSLYEMKILCMCDHPVSLHRAQGCIHGGGYYKGGCPCARNAIEAGESVIKYGNSRQICARCNHIRDWHDGAEGCCMGCGPGECDSFQGLRPEEAA